MSFWIDTHCHLPMLKRDPKEVLEEAIKNNVQHIITIGTEPEDHAKTYDIAETFFPYIVCGLGVHPHEAQKYNKDVEAFFYEKLIEPEVVVLGEIGLDYYYEHAPRKLQRTVFEKQLNIATLLDIPVQIHTRDAEGDTIAILKNFSGQVSGNIHCFTGSQYLADHVLELGLDISLSGIVTFKNARVLQDVVMSVPLDRLHIETDAPFLTPIPHRGKPNAPHFLVHTGAFLAQLKQIPLLDLQKQLQKNALKTFPKMSFSIDHSKVFNNSSLSEKG